MEMTDKRKRMKGIINQFKKYVDTYDKQSGCYDYEDITFIHDMLFGIGLCMDTEKYNWYSGYDKWKEYLKTII